MIKTGFSGFRLVPDCTWLDGMSCYPCSSSPVSRTESLETQRFKASFFIPVHMISPSEMTMILRTILGGESYAENQSQTRRPDQSQTRVICICRVHAALPTEEPRALSHNCCYFVFADGIIRLTLNVWSGYAIKPVEEKCQTLSGEFGGRHMNNDLAIPQDMISEIREIMRSARSHVAQQVNNELLAAYWNSGRVIVEHVGQEVLFFFKNDNSASSMGAFSIAEQCSGYQA